MLTMIKNLADAVRSANPIIWILLGFSAVVIGFVAIFFPEVARFYIATFDHIQDFADAILGWLFR